METFLLLVVQIALGHLEYDAPDRCAAAISPEGSSEA